MEKERWIKGILNGKRGMSKENGNGYIVYIDGCFVDDKGIPKQINNHNTGLCFEK